MIHVLYILQLAEGIRQLVENSVKWEVFKFTQQCELVGRV